MPRSLIVATTTAGIMTLAGLVALPASAADLTIEVHGVRSGAGHLFVAVHTQREGEELPYAAGMFAGTLQQAREGSMRFVFLDLPAGRYAVQGFHDENGNGELDSSALGIPTEGYGFANDPPSQFGPPIFEEVAVTISDELAKAVLTITY